MILEFFFLLFQKKWVGRAMGLGWPNCNEGNKINYECNYRTKTYITSENPIQAQYKALTFDWMKRKFVMVIYFTKSPPKQLVQFLVDYSGSSRNPPKATAYTWFFKFCFNSWSKENLNFSTLRLMPSSTETEICHGQRSVHSVTTGSWLHKRMAL